jgi:hypothetical protein
MLGNTGVSFGGASYESLAFSQSGQPYLAFFDDINYGKATVKRFDGTNWVDVGNAGFSTRDAKYTCLAFSPSGEPFLAYVDVGDSSKATVMRFNGTNWVNVGKEGFSEGATSFTSLAFSPYGQPYVGFSDSVNSYKVTVMKFDSSYLGINEQKEVNLSLYPNPAKDKITIQIAEGQAPSQLSILNLNGEEVLARSLIKPKTQIDISNLSGGVYFVRLMNFKTVEVGKFVKQ